MASIKNIRLILTDTGQELDYTDEQSLGIKLSRIVDDFQKPEKKHTEWSYNFNIPFTKNNIKIFEFANVKGRTEIFKGKTYNCRLVSSNEEILTGVLELDSFDGDSFNALFYNRYNEFADDIKGKKLRSLTSLNVVENWEYEKSIVEHIRANKSYEETDHQFPFIFYRTLPNNIADDFEFIGTYKTERDLFWYNWLTAGATTNPMFYAQFPPAVYLVKIINAIISESGWSLGGSFFEKANIKKIIVPFTGSIEDLQKAIYTGSTGIVLDINRTLIDMTQDEFLKTIMLTFNLYLSIDATNKTISFETFNTLFSDNLNPYDITDKVISKIKTQKVRGNTKIVLDNDNNNSFVTGYGRILDYSNLNSFDPMDNVQTNKYIRSTFGLEQTKTNYTADVYDNLWSKQGLEGEIKLKLSPCNYAPVVFRSDYNVDQDPYFYITSRVPYFSAAIPFISPQTPSDDKGKKAYDDVDTITNKCEQGDPSRWAYDGKLKLLYWYGNATWNYKIDTTNGEYNKFTFSNIVTGGTDISCTNPTFTGIPLQVASPYQLLTQPQMDYLLQQAGNWTEEEKRGVKGAELHYLMLTYMVAGTTGGTHHSNVTDYSLNFSDSLDLTYQNLYSYFHKAKYDQANDQHLLSFSIRCDENTWGALQINRTIIFDNEYYRLVALKNYNIGNDTAQITILKK